MYVCVCVYIYIYIYNIYIGLMSRVFANGLGDWGLTPGQVIPKTQKMVLDTTLLSTQHYKLRIKGKWSNPRNGVVPSPTPQCSSFWKVSLWVTLDYGRQLYLYIVSWLIIVKSDQKAPFSKATTLRCKGRHYYFSCIAPFTFIICWVLSKKVSSTIFLNL